MDVPPRACAWPVATTRAPRVTRSRTLPRVEIARLTVQVIRLRRAPDRRQLTLIFATRFAAPVAPAAPARSAASGAPGALDAIRSPGGPGRSAPTLGALAEVDPDQRGLVARVWGRPAVSRATTFCAPGRIVDPNSASLGPPR